MDDFEKLQETPLGYCYYEKQNGHPLNIDLDYSKDSIKVTVERWYKGWVTKTVTKRSAVLKPMSKQQIEDYIEDVVDLFLEDKRRKDHINALKSELAFEKQAKLAKVFSVKRIKELEQEIEKLQKL